MDKLKITSLKKVWPEDVQDFRRFAKHQDTMTYVLESSREVSSEGFTDLKQDLLLYHHDCHVMILNYLRNSLKS